MISSHVLASGVRAMHRIEDLVVFPLPERWLDLPEESQLGLSWWHLMDLLYYRRIYGEMQPISPIQDVDIQLLRNGDEAREFVPRTFESSSQLEMAVTGFLHGVGEMRWVACQFAYDGPVHD